MEEELKNDLAGIAFSHPYFSDIVMGVLNYIEKLEKRNRRLDKDNLILEEDILCYKVKLQNNLIPVIDELEKDGFVGYADELRDILDEVIERE